MHGSDPVRCDGSLAALPTVGRLIRACTARKMHVGAQLYVSLDGNTVADAAVGDASPGVAASRMQRSPWACLSKQLTAVLVARASEAGHVDLDAPVVEYIPEFGAHGKHQITSRHLLTHTSGIAADPLSIAFSRPWPDVIDYVCDLRPARREPGYHVEYVRESAWFTLAEVLRRVLAIDDYAAYVNREIFQPLEMLHCSMALGPDDAPVWRREVVPVQLMVSGSAVPWLCPLNDLSLADRCSPGISGRGPVREFARFYEALLGIADRPQLVSDETTRLMTKPHALDRRHREDYGLGFFADRPHHRFDRFLCPTQGFGHTGLDSYLSVGDFRTRLAAVVVFNGLPPQQALARQRLQMFVAAVYRDLELPLYEPQDSRHLDVISARLDSFLAGER